MPEVLLLGTTNTHKAAELREILAGLPWEVRCLADYPALPEPGETGHTFEENALLKASCYCRETGCCCAADDSGLVVDALGGAPGIYSARYAGPEATDDDNNRRLLNELATVPESERTARFVCSAALVHPDGWSQVETGTVEGRIALEPRGQTGFGYDPLFIPQGYEQTFAELGALVKQRISHRARAFQKLRKYLEDLDARGSSNSSRD
ncbi:MAG: RdgB/HAM1 family non-canonical purine NTP pyrophosphatase [Candidatus Hydrogenedentales bacterium]